MEFTHGIRDRLSTTDGGEEQVEVSTHLPFIPSYPLPSSSSTAFRWHDDSSGAGDCASTEKEHMFYKVVTPSDVGKLNRLVIPKQHAEKYFPLDTSANEKGLLLSFEDRTGKPWRFRYSYWRSSQSYVMTKGWSRFVKEKGLQAGDTISFGRGVGDAGRHRLFIDWKRRPENRDPPRIPLPELSFARSAGPWSGRVFVPPEAGCGHTWQGHTYPAASLCTGSGQFLCYSLPAARPPQMEVQQAGRSGFPMVLGSPLPLVRNQPAVKRVRLFGVTLDCPESGGGANYDGHNHSVCVPQLHPGAALPLLQSPDAPSPAPSSSNTSAGGRRRYRSLEEVMHILSRSKIDSILDRLIKAMNASSREHACSSFMEKAGEFLTLREHTFLLPSHVEEIDTGTAGPGSDGEVAPNEKKAR